MIKETRKLIILSSALGLTASLASFAEGAAQEALTPARGVTDVVTRAVLAGIMEASPYVRCSSSILAFCSLVAAVVVGIHAHDGRRDQ